MILVGTLVILALWLAFIWFVDPDGHRGERSVPATRESAELSNE